MRRGLLAGVLAAVMTAALLPWSGASEPPPRVEIAAWNIEFLGQPHNRSGPGKDVAQSPQDIADYIRASHADVLSVEEISFNAGSDDDRQNTTLAAACAILSQQPGNQWKHRLFAKREPGAKDQSVGLVWNEARVQPKATEDGQPFYRLKMEVPMDHPDFDPNAHYFDRWATAMKFSAGPGKTDVVLIPVHLKANVGGVIKTRRQRHVEAAMLAKAIPQVRTKFHDDDIIILGDTNILHNDEPATTTITLAGFNDLNFLDAPTHQGGAPFDRAFVADDTSGKNKEFAHSNQDVFHHPDFTPALFKKRLSDHFMIRFSVEVMDDDD
jgi:hypothetical protein